MQRRDAQEHLVFDLPVRETRPPRPEADADVIQLLQNLRRRDRDIALDLQRPDKIRQAQNPGQKQRKAHQQHRPPDKAAVAVGKAVPRQAACLALAAPGGLHRRGKVPGEDAALQRVGVRCSQVPEPDAAAQKSVQAPAGLDTGDLQAAVAPEEGDEPHHGTTSSSTAAMRPAMTSRAGFIRVISSPLPRTRAKPPRMRTRISSGS